MKIEYLIILIIAFLILAFSYYYFFAKETILELNKYSTKNYQKQIKNFENEMTEWLPLNNDFYKIKHSDNYMKFFETIGDAYYYTICLAGNKVIGTCCLVLKNVNHENVFFISDLKVHPDYRGKKYSIKMLSNFQNKLKITRKMYSVFINTRDLKKIVGGIIKRFPTIPFKSGGTLYIFSVDFKKMMQILPVLKKYRGNRIGFRKSEKQVCLKSNDKQLDIFHLDYNTNEQNFIQGAKYIFCCHESETFFIKELKIYNVSTNTFASIIHHDMDNFDWKFIKTFEF